MSLPAGHTPPHDNPRALIDNVAEAERLQSLVTSVAFSSSIEGATMILGMSTSTFTAFHTILSLVAILAGLVALCGWLRSRQLGAWTALFLGTTVLTSVTGYFFPRDQILPSHIVGALSLVLLALAIAALYGFRLGGAWRLIYVATATMALYLNVFVLVVQGFLKVPTLNALAPTGKEAPFVIAQAIVLVLFAVLGFVAVRSFHPRRDDGVASPVVPTTG
jgi:hypothetical protein